MRTPALQRLLNRLRLARWKADQHDARGRQLANVAAGLFRLLVHRDLEPEGRAKPNGAFQADLPPHEFYELLGDGGPKPRAAEASGRGLVGLRKTFENPRLRVRGDTDAGIADGEFQLHPRRIFCLCRNMDGDTS